MGSVSVLLVDDHAVVRAGCRQLLESWGGFVVAEASSAAEGLRMAAELQPALVILDLNLPDRNGMEAIGDFLALQPAPRILIFTMHEDLMHAARAMTLGAHGFVTKSDDPETIVEAAKRVAAGDFYLSHPVAQRLAQAKTGRQEDPFALLTRREREVLRLFGEGMTLGEIASALALSYKTVANTCSQIKGKLGVTTSAELMRVAVVGALGKTD